MPPSPWLQASIPLWLTPRQWQQLHLLLLGFLLQVSGAFTIRSFRWAVPISSFQLASSPGLLHLGHLIVGCCGALSWLGSKGPQRLVLALDSPPVEGKHHGPHMRGTKGAPRRERGERAWREGHQGKAPRQPLCGSRLGKLDGYNTNAAPLSSSANVVGRAGGGTRRQPVGAATSQHRGTSAGRSSTDPDPALQIPSCRGRGRRYRRVAGWLPTE